MGIDKMGRLSLPPHGQLFELLYKPQIEEDRLHVLPYLLRVDAAHILMLGRRGIISPEVSTELLALNQELTDRQRNGEPLLEPPPSHRGLFWLYEQTYIARLGPAVGGAAHVARSRNDLNATVARMRMREELLGVLDACADLISVLQARAVAHSDTLMSFFTHLQPAQPSTLGHYLTGVLSELLRTSEWLAGTYAVVNRSPMGAAAGAGTSLPIDQQEVAQWLGFGEVIENSADAVASRDYVVHVLSGMAMLGVTLTRLATDLQAWSSFAYGFIDWPDDLVSTSSIMPQKRNAFVLENVRNEAAQVTGALVNTLFGMKSTPFTNSVESSAVTAPAWPAFAACGKAIRLTALLLDRLEAHPERMRAFLEGAQTTTTALADLLVIRHGLAFRTAHDVIGSLLRELPDGTDLASEVAAARLHEIASAAAGHPVDLEMADLAAVLDPQHCLREARWGGGPAPDSVAEQLRLLDERRLLLIDKNGARRSELEQAERRLAEAIATALQNPLHDPIDTRRNSS